MEQETRSRRLPHISRRWTVTAVLVVLCAVSAAVATTLDNDTGNLPFMFAVFIMMSTAWCGCLYVFSVLVNGLFVGTLVGLGVSYALLYALVA